MSQKIILLLYQLSWNVGMEKTAKGSKIQQRLRLRTILFRCWYENFCDNILCNCKVNNQDITSISMRSLTYGQIDVHFFTYNDTYQLFCCQCEKIVCCDDYMKLYQAQKPLHNVVSI